MKKLLTLLFAAVLLASFAGCSNDSGDKDTKSDTLSSSQTETEKKREEPQNVTESSAESEASQTFSGWSSMYYKYLTENEEPLIWSDYPSELSSNTPLALHDFDMDGTPELIIGAIGARLGLSVYTINDGEVVHAGDIGGKSSFYSDNESYRGIFREDSYSNEHSLNYSELSDGKIICHNVISDVYVDGGDIDRTINDETLYEVYLDCTTPNENNKGPREPKNSLDTSYTWEDVQSNGWDDFLAFYGY